MQPSTQLKVHAGTHNPAAISTDIAVAIAEREPLLRSPLQFSQSTIPPAGRTGSPVRTSERNSEPATVQSALLACCRGPAPNTGSTLRATGMLLATHDGFRADQ